MSLSARRAWIEMIASANFCRNRFVALRKESVDRNVIGSPKKVSVIVVALRKESVDRNLLVPEQHTDGISVALRKESVDRNTLRACAIACIVLSLSARRAWIEMLIYFIIYLLTASVALRKESVDRNNDT